MAKKLRGFKLLFIHPVYISNVDNCSRFKTIVKTKGLQSSVERRMKIQEEIRKVKQLTRDNLNERKKLREEHRLRRKDNLKKREENQRKAEVVQVVCLKLSGSSFLLI